MSRIGRQTITLPEKVELSVADGIVTVKGPKGELTEQLHEWVSVNVEDGAVHVTVANPEDGKQKAMWGTFASLVSNMIEGVTDGFEKKLEINGTGYNFKGSGKKLTVNAGYSHPVDMELPEGVEMNIEDNVLTLTSANKQVLGAFASKVRAVRPPEPYKGKGIKYLEEQIRRKQGKQAVGGE